MRRSVNNIFILHKLVIWKIPVILIRKKIQLSLWYEKSPLYGIKVTPCFQQGITNILIPNIYKPHIRERTLF